MEITKMWHRDMKWTDAVGKMVPTDLLDARLPETFSLKKYGICEEDKTRDDIEHAELLEDFLQSYVLCFYKCAMFS